MLRGIQQIDRYLVSPGLIVILLAGIYMLGDGHIERQRVLGQRRLRRDRHPLRHGRTASSARTRRRRWSLPSATSQSGDTLSAEYEAVSKKLETGGKIAGAIVAITIFFMVVQP